MINFDMIGRMVDRKVVVYGVETASEFRPLLDSVNSRMGLAMTAQGGGYGPSDHSSFTAARLPVLHFFTGTHQDYHRTTDDWERINVEGIRLVGEFTSELIRKLGAGPERLTFHETPAPAAPAGQSRSGGYGAYLGSVPDMTESPGGVRLSGVRAGSPAERAGLRAGDILVRIGEHQVTDLQAMTEALRAYRPDESADVVVVREGERITLRVTFGRRGN
jgi:membrane-associated protease RseP (regulator of RpoE activity)